MTEQGSSQLATRRDLKSILAMPAIKSRFQEILHGNSAGFVTNILNAAASNPAINDCDPVSVINAALTAATLGLSVNPALGQAAIVPYKNKAQMIVQVKGLIQLAHKTNKYRTIHVAPIYEGEGWDEDRFTGQLRLTGARQSSKIVGWVAYFALFNGFEKYLAMSVDDIVAHAQKFSKAWDKEAGKFKSSSAWATNFDAMCKKTPLRLILMNYGPMTMELEQVLAADDPEDAPTVTAITPELIARAEADAEQNQPAARSTEQTMLELGY